MFFSTETCFLQSISRFWKLGVVPCYGSPDYFSISCDKDICFFGETSTYVSIDSSSLSCLISMRKKGCPFQCSHLSLDHLRYSSPDSFCCLIAVITDHWGSSLLCAIDNYHRLWLFAAHTHHYRANNAITQEHTADRSFSLIDSSFSPILDLYAHRSSCLIKIQRNIIHSHWQGGIIPFLFCIFMSC